MIPVKTVPLVIIVVLVTVFAYRQVDAIAGTLCGSKAECGFAEECIFNADLEFPCEKGICQCTRDYVADLNGLCQKLVSRKLFESCTNVNYEVLPANTQCYRNSTTVSTVICQADYVVSGTACIRPIQPANQVAFNSLGEGQPCQKTSDCMGDMQCGDGAKYICVCRAVYMRFDKDKNKCVRREFGDPCTRDTQCNVYAHPWYNWFVNFDGYNYREGRCVRGVCVCNDNGVSQVRISYLEGNNTVITKTICVVSGASVVKKGARCTINPIGWGASTQTAICETGTICYQCPEEYTYDNFGVQSGSCRAIKNPVIYDLQRQNMDPNYYIRPAGGDVPPGYDERGYSITQSTTTTQPRTTEPVIRKRVGDICMTNADCGTNEICNMASNVDTACTRGFCACRPCHAVDSLLHYCFPFQPRVLNDLCYYSDNEILPKNAACDRGFVRCKWGYAPALVGGDCVRQRGVGGYGDECSSSSQCIDGLVCNLDYYMCDCAHIYQMWDNATQACVNREFNDPCSDEDECRVPGGEWSGFTYAGGTCYRGRCACAPYNQQVTAGFVDQVAGILKTKTICINDGAQLNAAKGARCTVDPIRYGQTPSAKVCQSSNICYQCPEDFYQTGNTGEGFCRAFSRSPPQPNCEAYLTTTTSSPIAGW